SYFLFLLQLRPPSSAPFPYTTLFRSAEVREPHLAGLPALDGGAVRHVAEVPELAERHHVAADLGGGGAGEFRGPVTIVGRTFERDRKSTRLNSSHVKISYAVFCLKKK